MTTTIQASLVINGSCIKSQNVGDPTASVLSQQMNLGIFSQSWAAGTPINGVDAWSGLVTMSGGTASIDLTALTQLGSSTTFNMTGYKLRFIQWFAPAANGANVKIAPGASNGYAPVGVIDTIAPGDPGVKPTLSATAVDSTHKILTITGTGTDAIELLLVFGNAP